jgi:hypothetical protein
MKAIWINGPLERESNAPGVKVYTVEVDKRGCSSCGNEAGYTVVGPDGVEECAVYNDRGVAEEIADLMNNAYEQGRRAYEEERSSAA